MYLGAQVLGLRCQHRALDRLKQRGILPLCLPSLELHWIFRHMLHGSWHFFLRYTHYLISLWGISFFFLSICGCEANIVILAVPCPDEKEPEPWVTSLLFLMAQGWSGPCWGWWRDVGGKGMEGVNKIWMYSVSCFTHYKSYARDYGMINSTLDLLEEWHNFLVVGSPAAERILTLSIH